MAQAGSQTRGPRTEKTASFCSKASSAVVTCRISGGMNRAGRTLVSRAWSSARGQTPGSSEVPAASDPTALNLGATGVNDTLSCPKDAVGHRRGAQIRGCTWGAWVSIRSRAMDETWA